MGLLAAAALAALVQTPSIPAPPDPHARSTPRQLRPARGVAELPDGSLLVLDGGGVSTRLDAETGAPLGRFPAEPIVETLRVHHGSRTLAWFGEDGAVRVVPLEGADPAGWTSSAVFDANDGDDTDHRLALEWTHDGGHLVTWRTSSIGRGYEVPARIWTREGELLWEGPPAREVAVHPTRNALYAATDLGLLMGWYDDGFSMTDVGGAVTTVDVSPCGSRVALGGSRPRHDPTGLRAPWVWVRDAGTGAPVREEDVRAIDWMQIKQYAQRVRYSPDGCRIGVGVGEGAAVGVVDADDLGLVWTGGFRGGMMNAVFGVEWTAAGDLVSPWPKGWIVDVDAADPIRELPWMLRASTITARGSTDLVGIGCTYTEDFVVRLDPRTGDVRWTWPRVVPSMESR